MGIDVMFGPDGTYDMVVGHTRESRDKLRKTMDAASKKMQRERLCSIVLAEHDGITVNYRGNFYGIKPEHEIGMDYCPGRGCIYPANADTLSDGYSEIFGEEIRRQEAVNRAQESLEAYLAAPTPEPIVAPPKGILRRMIDYVMNKFN